MTDYSLSLLSTSSTSSNYSNDIFDENFRQNRIDKDNSYPLEKLDYLEPDKLGRDINQYDSISKVKYATNLYDINSIANLEAESLNSYSQNEHSLSSTLIHSKDTFFNVLDDVLRLDIKRK